MPTQEDDMSNGAESLTNLELADLAGEVTRLLGALELAVESRRLGDAVSGPLSQLVAMAADRAEALKLALTDQVAVIPLAAPQN
jgi:hypothetical protein